MRTLDMAHELTFLALECERLGAPELKRHIFGAGSELTGDAPPDILVHFYQSYRACVRPKIAIWHLNESALRDLPQMGPRWPDTTCGWPRNISSNAREGPAVAAASGSQQVDDRSAGMKSPNPFREQADGAQLD